MELTHNVPFSLNYSCSDCFTLGKKYTFTFLEGSEYSVVDDNGEEWVLSHTIIFNFFTFGFEDM